MSATLELGGELERITGQPEIHRIKAPEGWDRHGIGLRYWCILNRNLRNIWSITIQANEGKIKRPEPSRIPNSDLRSCLKYLSNFIGSDHIPVLFYVQTVIQSVRLFPIVFSFAQLLILHLFSSYFVSL